MPSYINVHASSAHRLGCISLYRALLKQSHVLSAVGSNDGVLSDSSDALSNLVRFRFRNDRHLQSPAQIVNSLKTGYAVLDLIHACNYKSPTALVQAKALLESTASHAEHTTVYRAALAAARSPTSPQKLAKIGHLRAVAKKANFTRYPGSKPVLQRPLPLSEIKGGKRRVPNLISAQGVPFLRYSKPQPISLSRIIRQKQERAQKKWTQQQELQADMVIAQWEDDWDEMVQAQMSQEQSLTGGQVMSQELKESSAETDDWGERWRCEIVLAETELYRQMKENDQKNTELGRTMWEIVVKERLLAAQEEREAKIQRRIERKAVAAAADPPVMQATG